MNKLVTVIVAAAACAAATPIAAFPAMPGLPAVPGLPGRGVQHGAVSIDVWLNQADQADRLFFRSARIVFEMVATKEQIEEMRARQQAIDAVADPQERERQQQAMQSDVYATLAQVDYDSANQDLEKRLDDRQRQRLGAAIFNSGVATFIDVQLVAEGPGVGNDLRNTAMSGDIGNAARKATRFHEVFDVMHSQLSSWQRLHDGFAKLRSAGRLQTLATSASDAPIAVAD